jgi:hypothetical protein
VVACHPEEEWSSGSCPNLWEWDFDRGRRTVTSPLKFFAAGQACRTNSPHPPHPPSVRQREPTPGPLVPARRNLAPGEIMGGAPVRTFSTGLHELSRNPLQPPGSPAATEIASQPLAVGQTGRNDTLL